MAINLALLVEDLRLVNSRGLNLLTALDGPPTLTLSIEQAHTLQITIADSSRVMTRSGLIDTKSWARLGDLRFEKCGVSKSGDRITVTYEDGIVADLRRRTGKFSIPAGTSTRAQFFKRLAREIRVPAIVDDTPRGNVQSVLSRSTGGEKTNSWDISGPVAEDVRWRRFSNGRALVAGGDEWLLELDKAPTTVREFAGGIGYIDFDLDTGRRASTARVSLTDVRGWKSPPGDVVRVAGCGPADGRWIVSGFSRPLDSLQGTADLVRLRHALKEPKREKKGGDSGDPGYTPGHGGTDNGGRGANPGRDRMVSFALAQNGKPYEYGDSGPGSFDCSGLVQEATRAGGRVLSKPSSSQWDQVKAAGKTLSIADALRTRGALLFRIGVSEYNHVAISLGNGSTVEARGEAYGCGVFGNAGGQGWTGAGLWI